MAGSCDSVKSYADNTLLLWRGLERFSGFVRLSTIKCQLLSTSARGDM
ncbi:MAG: hypothetical protein IJP88_01155 [Synergistaceae bacterium]|nr:hypothetical protein [Synergistaceae bacterium]